MHLITSSHMLPYFFVATRTNCSRWMPAYIIDILELPEDIRSVFEVGQFAIRPSSGKFNAIWSDMSTEKNIINDSKGSYILRVRSLHSWDGLLQDIVSVFQWCDGRQRLSFQKLWKFARRNQTSSAKTRWITSASISGSNNDWTLWRWSPSNMPYRYIHMLQRR
jgi:hypothetical protein